MLHLPTLDKENVTLQPLSNIRKKPPYVNKAPITTSQFGQLKHWRKLWMSLEKNIFIVENKLVMEYTNHELPF